jgi:hypothetical protein
VHCLVTGGGISDDGRDWRPARRDYLVPTKALAVLVRAKMKAALARCRLDLIPPKAAWSKPWVVDCTAWGDGAEAVLRYLARYVFRVAITESRIVGLDDIGVTIRRIVHRGDGARRVSMVTSSCAASCSTCCQRGSTRSDTPASGIRAVAKQPHEPDSSWLLIARQFPTTHRRTGWGRRAPIDKDGIF